VGCSAYNATFDNSCTKHVLICNCSIKQRLDKNETVGEEEMAKVASNVITDGVDNRRKFGFEPYKPYVPEVVDKENVGELFFPHTFQTKVRLSRNPIVLITPKVMFDILSIVKQSAQEVGWLGTIKQHGKIFLLDKVHLLKQEVAAATTEITPEGLSDFYTELIDHDGPEAANTIRLWGHSHVQMDTFASAQDESQMEVFMGNNADYFIRMIANKKGKISCSIFYKDGLVIDDCCWMVSYNRVTVDDAGWLKEIKAKVTPLTYKYTPATQYGGYHHNYPGYGGMD